jgi:hypothetical protein
MVASIAHPTGLNNFKFYFMSCLKKVSNIWTGKDKIMK